MLFKKLINSRNYATRYSHRDHLGSVEAISDATAKVANTIQLSYDAWGKRCNADWTDATDAIDTQGYRNGFTCHEHIDEIGLVHMNGRVYDPTLGRFLSADPHVQFEALLISYNRYAYVNNNPLRYSDPSGYFLNKLERSFRRAIRTNQLFASVVQMALSFIPVVGPFIAAPLVMAAQGAEASDILRGASQ